MSSSATVHDLDRVEALSNMQRSLEPAAHYLLVISEKHGTRTNVLTGADLYTRLQHWKHEGLRQRVGQRIAIVPIELWMTTVL